MVHRFFLRRFVFLLLVAALLFGGARALFGAGYRQGFVQGSLLAAGDGQAVTIAPEAAFRAMTHWGLGPMEAMFCGLPLALLGLGGLAFVFATGARRHATGGPGRHGPHRWAHHPSHRPTDDIGPEKQPKDYV
jgi:hypothetical protein